MQANDKDVYQELADQYKALEKKLEDYQEKKKEFGNIYTLAIAEIHNQQVFIAELLIKHGKGWMINTE